MKKALKIFFVLGICINFTACQCVQPVTNYLPANFSEVVKDKVYRGGQPTNAQLENLKEKFQIKTVIKLNFEEEEAKGTNEKYEEEKAKDISVRVVNAQTPPSTKSIKFYQAPDYANIQRAVNELEDKNNWPIYIHCSHGQDRTGLVVALFRVMNTNKEIHMEINDAGDEMKEHGFHSYLFGLSEYWKQFKKLNGKTLPRPTTN